jgi:hypothetical protein
VEKERLINYLQDVYQLQIQNKIEKDTMLKLEERFRHEKENFEFNSRERYQTSPKVLKRIKQAKIFIAVALSLICCSAVGLMAVKHNIAMYQELVDYYTSSYNEAFLESNKRGLEENLKDYNSVKTLGIIGIIFGGGGIAAYIFAVKSKEEEQEEMRGMASILRKDCDNNMKIIWENYNIAQTAYNNTEKVLKQLYNLDIIYPKYRYLEACGTFLEYLLSGRAPSLEATPGYSGAYTLFEEDLFRGLIVDKLDRILENQKMLIRGQREITNKVNELIHGVENMQKKMNGIKQDIQKISHAEEMNVFYNSITAYNTSVIRRISENYYR